MVSYCNDVKAALLGVSPDLLEEFGPVCEPVAKAMAEGARKALGCDIAISFTGVAGPGPDDLGNPEGLVFVAVTDGNVTRVRKLQQGHGRDRIRTTAVNHGLDMVRRLILDLNA